MLMKFNYVNYNLDLTTFFLMKQNCTEISTLVNAFTFIKDFWYFFNIFSLLTFLRNVIRHRSAVRIRGFHPRDRGSTPRVGNFIFFIFFLLFETIFLFSLVLLYSLNLVVLFFYFNHHLFHWGTSCSIMIKLWRKYWYYEATNSMKYLLMFMIKQIIMI